MNHKFLEPIKIGNVEVKNRIVFLAMAKTMSNFDNVVSERDVAYIESVAAGGVGIVIPGAMIVDPEWPSVLPMQPAIWHDKFLPGLKRLVDVSHKHDAKILFQLWHPGATIYSGVQPKTVDELTVEEIKYIQAKFVAAAQRAMDAGADGIEFQTCHGYLANQFVSPLFNHRTDEYGWENPEDRTRFACECIAAIREVIGPDKILSVKMQGFDYPKGEGLASIYGADGIDPEQAAQVAPYFEKAGADMLTVSAGGTIFMQDDIMAGDVRRAEGWKVPAAAMVKQAVSVPVVATGSIRHPEYVDQIISEGKCDMVGMGRGILAEREWVKKCAEGREDELRYCISCLNCWNVNPFAHEQTNCSVNPFALRELSQRPLNVNGEGRVVVIVGAGPAGMEAAVTLKQRGFTPVVFEKSDKIGGNIHIAKKPICKGKFDWAIDYYVNMAKKLDIDVRLNTEATVEGIMALNPYSVLIATGSNIVTFPIEGAEAVPVYEAHDVLVKDLVFEGKKIAVVGGGITGLEVAQLVREQGNEVAVIDMLPEWPLGALEPRYQMEALIEVMHSTKAGLQLYYNHKVEKYADGKLIAVHTENGSVLEVEADMLIMAVGVKPNNDLYVALKMMGHPSVWMAGDAIVTGKINKAVTQGSKFGYALN